MPISLPAPVSPYSKENSGTRPGARLRIQAEVGKCLCQRAKFLCWAEVSAALLAVVSSIGVSSLSSGRDYSAGVLVLSFRGASASERARNPYSAADETMLRRP